MNPLRGPCALAVAPCEFSTSPTNPLRRFCVSDRSRCGAVRILHAGRRTLCENRACGSALAVALCEFARWPTNPLRGSCVSQRSRCGAVRGSCLSEHSRCGAVRTFYVADEPSAGIVRVGALALWRRANFLHRRRTLCGDYARRIALAAAPCEFARWPKHPLRGSCVSDRSCCGAVRIYTLADEPSAGIAVAPCGFARWPMNPLRGSCVSDRSRCGAVRICMLADEPSAGIVRVGSLSLWFSSKLSTKVVCEARSRTSGLRMASFK